MKITNIQDGYDSRFVAEHEGYEAGEANYELEDGVITITHVGVDPHFRGRGLAKEIVMTVVEFAREKDYSIIPLCGYAKAVFQRYPDIEDVLYLGE